ncbi:MAG: divalent-cation tolerance protein CutA [Elusimicrobiota bacterium]
MATAARVVLVTVPRGGKAESMADGLVEARLAACVNILPGAVSIYRWKGRVRRDAESVLVVKTTAPKLKKLERWIKERHPYEVPEFIVLPVVSGSREYLSWLAEQVR